MRRVSLTVSGTEIANLQIGVFHAINHAEQLAADYFAIFHMPSRSLITDEMCLSAMSEALERMRDLVAISRRLRRPISLDLLETQS